MLRNDVRISPKNLALALDVPAYLFSDLIAIRGEMLADGSVMVNDSETPAVNGVILVGVSVNGKESIPLMLKKQESGADLFTER